MRVCVCILYYIQLIIVRLLPLMSAVKEEDKKKVGFVFICSLSLRVPGKGKVLPHNSSENKKVMLNVFAAAEAE